jgi:hypothetical protein
MASGSSWSRFPLITLSAVTRDQRHRQGDEPLRQMRSTVASRLSSACRLAAECRGAGQTLGWCGSAARVCWSRRRQRARWCVGRPGQRACRGRSGYGGRPSRGGRRARSPPSCGNAGCGASSRTRIVELAGADPAVLDWLLGCDSWGQLRHVPRLVRRQGYLCAAASALSNRQPARFSA